MALLLCLGNSFDLRRDGKPIELKNRKAQALLIYLALTGKPHSREHLATLLWGDRFDEQARGSLRQALFALRKVVGEGVVAGNDPLELADGAIEVMRTTDLLPGFSTGVDGFDTWLSRQRERQLEQAARVSRPPAHFIIARFEDFGGGDLPEYCAAEIPKEIVRRTSKLQGIIRPTAEHQPLNAENQAELMDEVSAAAAFGLIAGSVRQIADQLRVAIHIQEAGATADHWSNVFVFGSSDTFDSINRIAQAVTDRIFPIIGRSEDPARALRRLRAEAQDDASFLKDLHSLLWHAFYHAQTRRIMCECAEVLRPVAQSMDRHVDVLTYYAALTFHAAHLSDDKDRVARYRHAMETNERALALDPKSPRALSWKATYCAWLGDFDAAEQANGLLTSTMIEIEAYAGLRAVALVMQGRIDEAIPLLEQAIRAERGTANMFYRHANLALAHLLSDNEGQALLSAEYSLAVSHEFFLGHLVKIAALERLGRRQEAGLALEDMRRAYRDPTVSEFTFIPIADAQRKRELLGSLRDAGMPD